MPCRTVPVLILLTLPGPSAGDEPAKKPVPVYTNADLERVSPARGDTGVLSTPAAAPTAASRPEPTRSTKGEDYWREQVDRLRERLRPLEERAEDLRQKIADRRREPGVRPYTDPKIAGWERRLASLEARRRDLEARFEERARRAGALPGWLR